MHWRKSPGAAVGAITDGYPHAPSPDGPPEFCGHSDQAEYEMPNWFMYESSVWTYGELQSNEPYSVAISGPYLAIGSTYFDQPPAAADDGSVLWQSAWLLAPQIMRSPAHNPSAWVAGLSAAATHVQGGIFLSAVSP